MRGKGVEDPKASGEVETRQNEWPRLSQVMLSPYLGRAVPRCSPPGEGGDGIEVVASDFGHEAVAGGPSEVRILQKGQGSGRDSVGDPAPFFASDKRSQSPGEGVAGSSGKGRCRCAQG